MGKGIFITGTDTDVGKTIVTAALALGIKEKGIDVGVMKPIATGAVISNDARISEDALFIAGSIPSIEDSIKHLNPVLLDMPLSPVVASRIEGKEIDIHKIINSYSILCENHDFMIVEGIGGILVPIQEDYFVTDLIKEMDLPIVIVTRPDLGTINHTLLTIREAERSNIQIEGIIFSCSSDKEKGIAEKTSPEIIKEISGIPVLGVLPFDPGIDVSALRYGNLKKNALKCIDLDKIIT